MNAVLRNHLIQQISNTTDDLNEAQLAEILDFAEFIKSRARNASPQVLTPDEHAALCHRWQAAAESRTWQPRGAAEFVREMRDGDRY